MSCSCCPVHPQCRIIISKNHRLVAHCHQTSLAFFDGFPSSRSDILTSGMSISG
jgi:hypothetical protein